MLAQERRRSERRAYANSVEIYSYETKKVIGNGFITNWSEGGFHVVAPHQFETGKKIIMFVDMLNGCQFDLLGEVVRVQKGADSQSCGVKFTQNQSHMINKLAQQLLAA